MTSELGERGRRTPGDDEMPALLAALAARGGNIAAFARERGLSPWKLYVARRAAAPTVRRARRRTRMQSAEFAEVRVLDETPRVHTVFELVLPGGQRLVIPPAFEEQALRRLLEVLGSC